MSKFDSNTTIELEYLLVSHWTQYPNHPLRQKIEIELIKPVDPSDFILPPCTPDLFVNETMIDSRYWLKQGDPTFVIDLEGISNNDCNFELSLNQDGHDVDPEIFRLADPTFKRSELN